MKLDNVEDVYPLSPLQQGILFESLAAPPGSGVYVEQFGYRLSGALAAPALQQAWRQLVERHAVLRTAFFWDGLDQPLQVVRRNLELPWTELDWRDRSAERQADDLAGLQRQQCEEGFPPDHAPLMRLVLIRLSEHTHFFLWSHHHLLLDGWCIPILVRELMALYHHAVCGTSAALPPVRPYRDYIQWLQQQDPSAAQRHWRARLGDFAVPTPLLGSLGFPAPSGTGCAHHETCLPEALARGLEALARSHRLTLNTVFQGAWALLLARVCRLDDVVFGATVSGRPPELRGVEDMVGLFINTVPVRVGLPPPGEGLVTWLAGLMAQQKEQEAFAYSALPEVQRMSAVPGGQALFDTLLVFENFPMLEQDPDRVLHGGVAVQTVSIVERPSHPLTLAVLPGPALTLRFYHDRARIGAGAVRWLADLLTRLLQGMVANPLCEPLRIPLLSPAELQALVAQHRPRAAAGVPRCLHHGFEQIAAARPDAPALTVLNERGEVDALAGTLSYGELNARANRLAHALIARGVEPDARIGLCLAPSAHLIVGMLGILKAGGAYVPIDPDLPADRQALLLEDAAVQLLVTDTGGLAQWPQHPARTLCVDDPHLGWMASSNPVSPVGPAHLAYVIYTSGSTGRPKGVLVEHRHVGRLFSATEHWFHFGASDVWTLFHSFAFDFSVWEIWGALLYGGRLVIPPYLLTRSPPALHRMLRREGVTVLNQTPSAFRQLMQADAEQAGEPGPALALRLVVFGGEALDYRMLAPWLARHAPDAPQLVNMYGITETTVHVSYRPVRPADVHGARSVIGQPLADLQWHVLDRHGQPVLPGLPGELHVGGAGVARGYWNRPELNTQRFVRLAVDPALGTVYRSGDLVRAVLDEQGQPVDLEFLGRDDEQVKIRGFRIETGEISLRLAAHPAVAQCVVLARREEETGAQRLVAYVVPDWVPAAMPLPSHAETRRLHRERASVDSLKVDVEQRNLDVRHGLDEADWPSIRHVLVDVPDAPGRVARAESMRDPEALIAALRESLAAELPAYMMPSDWVLLDAIPLTRNGKTDTAALARHQPGPGATPARAPAAPVTEDEQMLAGLWGSVLGIEAPRAVGRDDNFFELGGHSLLATRLMSRVREVFALELPIRELFDHPSVAQLAQRIALCRRQGTGAGAVALAPIEPDAANRYEPFPLTDIQQAYWLGRGAGFELGNVATHGYMEVDCRELDLPRFERAWQRLVERHDMLRMVVLPASGQQQVRRELPPCRIDVQDLSGRDAVAQQAALLALRERMSHQMLSAEEGPLFDIRACLLDASTTRLHLSIDALWGDAHSLRVLIAELFAHYHQPSLRLPPLHLNFRDYVLAEQGWRSSPWYEDSLRYWRERLSDFPPAPELPLRVQPSELERPRFVRRAGRLQADDWAALKRRAAQAGLTPSGALLAAYADILAFWSSSPRFTINLTVFNRHAVHPEVNQVIGDFTSLVLLAVDQAPEDRFETRAKRLQRQLWRDLDHRFVNGVTVLRELSRRRGGQGPATLMPVVFTSTLGLAPAGHASAPAPVGEVVYSITQTPQVWLDHKVSESAGALKFEWDAIDELFPAGLLDEMFDAYAALLRRLARDETAWRENRDERWLPAAQAAQRRAVNQTSAVLPQGLLQSAWLAQLPHCADEPAVIDPARTLTHGQLAARVNGCARRLRAGGVRRGEPVVVVMDKGWQQVVAVLGVLVAGGAYVPLDPQWPRERLAQVLAQVEASQVLTQAHRRDSLQWVTGVDVLCVEDLDHDLAPAGTPAPQPVDQAPGQEPGDLAYIIFTSGSTGVPKGVMIDHGSACNTVADVNARFGLGPRDRVLALSALSFDLSVWDVFGVLGAGGAVVLPEPLRQREPEHWLSLIAGHRVTVWNTVPALMQMLVDHVQERDLMPPPDLRLVMMSGDWIAPALPQRIRALWPAARQVSLGGATEASIWSIWHPIAEEDGRRSSIPYGKPLANQSFHVLNTHLLPCPVWVAGALYIGGKGLALGYWRDPEKTAAAFITHPRTGERLYRTGDLGRYLPDGSIEFLGREDQQVKLRGHRIELGEIEAVLRQHPQVRDAAVSVQGERHRAQRLLAHVVLREATDEVPEDTGVAAAGAAAAPGLLRDSAQRTEFKLSHPGLRADASSLAAVALARPTEGDALSSAYLQRQSHRRFGAEPLGAQPFGLFLAALAALDVGAVLPKRLYPSAGNLYPVQVYVAVKPERVEGLAAGLYWYHPLQHQLLAVAPGAVVDGAAYGPWGSFNRLIDDAAGFALFLVARPQAIRPLYGEAAAQAFCLLEAGYIGQLLMQSASLHGVGLCPVGGMDFAEVQRALRLEPDQGLLHCLLGGPVAPGPSQAWPQAPAQAASLAEDLARFVAGKLPAPMVPAGIVVLPALPLSANGKLDRGALKDQAEQDPADADPAEAYVAPRDMLEQALSLLWKDLLGRDEPIGVNQNFFDLGGNSLLAVRLSTQLLKRFQCQLMLHDIFHHPTLAELARVVRGQQGPSVAGDRSLSLVPMRSQGERAPFFCFPGSGGHALYLYHLARHLPADQPFYALQSQAVDGVTPPLTRVEAMAEAYVARMRSVQAHGPYHLGGHSLGAKIALEVAQQLMQAGEAVALLAVFDSLPFFQGEGPADSEAWDDVAWLAALARAAAGFGGEEAGDVAALLAPLSAEQRLRAIQQRLEHSQFLPSGSSVDQVRAMVALFRANTQANASYRARPVRPVPLALFSPQAQSDTDRAAMFEAWSAVGTVTAVHTTPGTHLSMLAQPHVQVLAARLGRCLALGAPP